MAAVELEDARGQVLQESAIVGDEQHRAVEPRQGFLEPGDGADVQVVGRLVEQQQVGFRDQRLGQQHAAAPAAGEFGQGLVRRQLQAAQGTVHQLLQAPAVARLEFLLDLRQPVQVLVALDVLAQVVELRQQLADAGQALGDHVEHATVVGTRQLLRQFADLQPGGAPDLAVVGGAITLDQAQQARFPVPLRPMTHTRSPRAICQDTWSSSGVVP